MTIHVMLVFFFDDFGTEFFNTIRANDVLASGALQTSVNLLEAS